MTREALTYTINQPVFLFHCEVIMPNLTSPIQYIDGSDHFGNRLRLPRDTMAVKDATFRDHYDPATGRVHVQKEGDRLHERLLQVASPLFYMDEKVVWVFFDNPGDPVWMEVRPETMPRERIVAELRTVLERFGLKPEGALQSAAVDSAIRAALDAYNTHLAHRSG